jgi:hypothetical protein
MMDHDPNLHLVLPEWAEINDLQARTQSRQDKLEQLLTSAVILKEVIKLMNFKDAL